MEINSLPPSSPRDSREFPFRNYSRIQEPSALEIAAEQMRLWNAYTPGIANINITFEPEVKNIT